MTYSSSYSFISRHFPCSVFPDFINMLISRFYAHKCSATQILFQQQYSAQHCQYTQLEVMTNFYYKFSTLWAGKISVNLLVQKLLILLMKLTPAVLFNGDLTLAIVFILLLATFFFLQCHTFSNAVSKRGNAGALKPVLNYILSYFISLVIKCIKLRMTYLVG